jgi:hypothetical protein
VGDSPHQAARVAARLPLAGAARKSARRDPAVTAVIAKSDIATVRHRHQ